MHCTTIQNSVVDKIPSHRTFWRFHVLATVTASFIACLLSSILHVNCVYTVIIDATFNLWSICKLEEAPGIEGFVMVLIMTNYFLCKLCIHTHMHTCTHTPQNTWMMPNLGLHDYALRSLWPHILSHVQSVLKRHGPAWPQSEFSVHIREGLDVHSQ